MMETKWGQEQEIPNKDMETLGACGNKTQEKHKTDRNVVN